MTTIVNPPDALLRQLRNGSRFLLCSHQNPDGDSIGSQLGLVRVLRALGKFGVMWSADPIPSVYAALPGADRIIVGPTPPEGFPEQFDAVLVMECPSTERTGLAEAIEQLPLLNIDHHLGNQHYGLVNWVDSAAPAVGELVYQLAEVLMVPVDSETANLLFMTLVTDTGCFRFSNATARTFESAAALVRAGASPEKVSGWLYESVPEGAVRLLGEMVSTLQIRCGGRLATAWVEQEMFDRAGAVAGDTEGLIDTPRSIAGVDAVALFRERGGQDFKVSLRSRGEVNVERVARSFGGGGHRNAAGFSFSGAREQLTDSTVELLSAELERNQ